MNGKIFESLLNNLIAQSNLPVELLYYIFKYKTEQLFNLYNIYITKEDEQNQQKISQEQENNE